MLVTSHHAPPAALKGVSRLDFQKALDRVLYGPADAAPSRDDDMQYKKPENSKEKEKMKNSGVPKSAEMPQ